MCGLAMLGRLAPLTNVEPVVILAIGVCDDKITSNDATDKVTPSKRADWVHSAAHCMPLSAAG